MRVVHPMEVLQDGHLMIDETVHQIFSERPQHHSTQRRKPPVRVKDKAAALDIQEQQSTNNERVDIQLGIVTDLGMVHVLTTI